LIAIADLVSTTPESVSRMFGEFREQGIINVKGNTIEILDAEKLGSMCKCDSLQAYKIQAIRARGGLQIRICL